MLSPPKKYVSDKLIAAVEKDLSQSDFSFLQLMFSHLGKIKERKREKNKHVTCVYLALKGVIG